MPVSDKQLTANRANAQKSTGPITEEGKAKSAANGFKSLITGLTTIMCEEDRAALDEFVDKYTKELAPQGVVETQLARTIALDSFRLNRIKTVEENMFAFDLVLPTREFTNNNEKIGNAIGHVWTYFQHSDKINRVSLYESRLNRCIKNNLDLLEKRQAQRKERLSQSQSEAATEIHIMAASAAAAHHEANVNCVQNESLKDKNGFVSANSETNSQQAHEVPPHLQKAA